MSRKDKYHNQVRLALEKDGWIVTHDPYMLRIPDQKGKPRDYPIDLGAENLLGAEKENIRIAIEIKTFGGSSVINDYHKALGQYMDYLVGLKFQEPDRKLFLAVTDKTFREIQANPLAKLSVEHYKISIILFDPEDKTIIEWIQ